MTLAPSRLAVAFAGGGTGGHLFPGLAVAEELQRRQPDIAIGFFGSGREIEQVQIPRHGFPYERLPAAPRPIRWTGWPRFFLTHYRSFRRAKTILRQRGIRLVVGLGGYGAAPLVRAAGALGLPVVLLEQNSVPGRANRYLARWATVICATFEASRAYFPPRVRVEITGNPLRRAIRDLAARPSPPADPREDGGRLASAGPAAGPPTLLVLGGSQGAHSLNLGLAALADRLAREAPAWQVVHQTGPEDADRLRAAYAQAGVTARVEPFFHDMAALYQSADLVVARAGATSLAEFMCAGLPAVLMPYPYAADDHQTRNAHELVQAGAALLVPDRQDAAVNAPALWAAIQPLLSDPARRHAMAQAMRALARPDAADRVVDLLLDVLFDKKGPSQYDKPLRPTPL